MLGTQLGPASVGTQFLWF